MKNKILILVICTITFSIIGCSSMEPEKDNVEETIAIETDENDLNSEELTETERTFESESVSEIVTETEEATYSEIQSDENSYALEDNLELNGGSKEFLKNMCYVIPDFSDKASIDDEFWDSFTQSICFMNYSLQSWGIEQISDGVTNNTVSQSNMEEIEFLTLGISSSYIPSKSYFYFVDGNYTLEAEYGDLAEYNYKDMKNNGDGTYTVIYEEYIGCETERYATIYITLVSAENSNGFIVSSKSTSFD